MVKSIRVLILALFVCPSVLGQTWTYPAKGTGVPCTGCGGSAEGLDTFPYDDPLTRHAGRFVDSTQVADFQTSIRTVRAHLVRSIPETGRLYVALGEALGAYSSSTFFTTALRRPMVEVSALGRATRGISPFETLTAPDAFFDAESNGSGWITPNTDGQKRLFDFDGDDRGYVYIANGVFGWGIEFDDGAVDGSRLDYVYQKPADALGFSPEAIVAFKTGTSYYVAVGGGISSPRTLIYDVTTPASPVLVATRLTNSDALVKWSRDSARQRLAMLSADGKVRVYDFAALAAATNAAPFLSVFELAPGSGRVFGGLAFDAEGSLWVAEGAPMTPGTAALIKLTPHDGSYSMTSTTIDGGAMAPRGIDVGGGFLAVAGRVSADGGVASTVRLFRFVDGTPELVDTSDFFQKYYHSTTAQGFARSSRLTFQHMRLVEEASKTYLIYGAHGLGDVFELERGEAVRIPTATSLDLTPNPSSSGTEVSLTATVSPQTLGTEEPVGAVTFTIDGFPLTTAPLIFENGAFRAMAVTTTLGKYPLEIVATYEGDDHYETSTSSATEHHPDFLMAPEGFDGILLENTVRLSWQRIPNVDRYQILRRQGSTFSVVHDAVWAASPTLSFDDPATPGAVHLYRVRGVSDDGTPGFESVSTAVFASTFTDPIVSAGVAIKALHINELRVALNAYRTALGLGPDSFDDPSLAPGMPIRALHIIQLRESFNTVRTEIGLASSSLPWAPSGSVALAQHIVQLRANVQ